MFWEEVLYYGDMKTEMKTNVMNWVGDGILWIAVIATASGTGLLLESIVDTVRYGHPR